VLDYLREHQQDDAARQAWYQHWIYEGFEAIEKKLARRPPADYCYGSKVTLADCFLIPQVYNAKRFHCDLSAYPNINRINANCLQLGAFLQASPENQKDYN
jgi:maleylacetoacetate isomerase